MKYKDAIERLERIAVETKGPTMYRVDAPDGKEWMWMDEFLIETSEGALELLQHYRSRLERLGQEKAFVDRKLSKLPRLHNDEDPGDFCRRERAARIEYARESLEVDNE